jgi:hypothetical protein
MRHDPQGLRVPIGDIELQEPGRIDTGRRIERSEMGGKALRGIEAGAP